MPIEIPTEYMGEDLIGELSQRLKEMQADFKEVHKSVEQIRSTGEINDIFVTAILLIRH